MAARRPSISWRTPPWPGSIVSVRRLPIPATSGGTDAPVGRQRRDRDALRTRGQDRSARGHRVGARAERRGHDEPIAGHPGVEHVVHADGNQDLPRPVADHREVVDGDRAVRLVPPDVESRDADGRPPAGGDLLERPRHALGGHRHQHADAPAGHAEHRARARGARVQRREGGPVPSEGEEQVAGRRPRRGPPLGASVRRRVSGPRSHHGRTPRRRSPRAPSRDDGSDGRPRRPGGGWARARPSPHHHGPPADERPPRAGRHAPRS